MSTVSEDTATRSRLEVMGKLALRYVGWTMVCALVAFPLGLAAMALGAPEWVADAVVEAGLLLAIKVWFDAVKIPAAVFWALYIGAVCYIIAANYYQGALGA